MPKTISANLKSHIGGRVTTIARCLKITLTNHQPEVVGVTKANPGAVTTRWDHRFVTGDVVRFVGVRGMTELNGNEYVVTVTGARTFTIGVDSTAFTTYTERGVAQRILGFTTYNKPFTFEQVQYNAAKAYSPSALKQASDLSVSSLNFIGIIDADEIKESDLRRGLYDNAKVEFFMVNYQSLGDGKMYFGPGRGNIGEVVLGRNMYEAEFRGLEHVLQQPIGSLYSPSCRAVLGDDQDIINKCNVRLEPLEWQATTAYTVRTARDAGTGSVVRPTTANGRHFKCTTEGTSAGSEPTWNTTIGATTNDGTVVWTAIEGLTKQVTIFAIGSGDERNKYSLNDLAEAESWYKFGVLTFIDGENRGMKFEIKDDQFTDYAITGVNQGSKIFTIVGDHTIFFLANEVFAISGSTGNDGNYTVVSAVLNSGDTDIGVSEAIPDPTVDGTISWKPKVVELFADTPFDAVVGDTVEVRAGCDKTLPTCRDKFDNIYNMRAEPYVPGQDKLFETPDANS